MGTKVEGAKCFGSSPHPEKGSWTQKWKIRSIFAEGDYQIVL